MAQAVRVLYVDESGDFAGTDRVWVLVGVGTSPPVPSTTLRAHIRAALPGVPWPPHAAHLNHPLYRPACLLAQPALNRDAPAPVARASEILDTRPVADAIRREVRLDGGCWKMALGPLNAERSWFRRVHPTLFDALQAVVKSQRRNMDLAIQALDGVRVFGAANYSPQPISPADRYIALWVALNRRAALIEHGEHTLVVVPAGFTVNGQSVTSADLAYPGVTVGRPVAYGGGPPGLILADHVANALRFALNRRPSTWRRLLQEWRRRRLPSLEVPWGPEQTLLPVLAISLDETGAEEAPTWAREQARVWANAIAQTQAEFPG